MAQEAEPADKSRPTGRKRRLVRKSMLVIVPLLLLAIFLVWLQREELADSLITDYFEEAGLEASYQIESISPRRQVLRDVIIGDPARPDLTVERVEIALTPRLGLPDVTRLTLTRPRIFGSYKDGQLSFGALDSFIFTDSDEPFQFPTLNLVITDGRGLLETDFGRVGLKLEGAGHLRGGFEGELAAIVPRLTLGGCEAERASLYGTIAIDAERPIFAGPARFAQLQCPDSGLTIGQSALALDMRGDRNLADFEGSGALASGAIQWGGDRLAGLSGDTKLTWRDGKLTAEYDFDASRYSGGFASIDAFAAQGLLRTGKDFDRLDIEGELAANDLRMAADLDRAIGDAAQAAQGSLLAPLLDKFGFHLARNLRGSELRASFTASRIGSRSSVVVPQATLRGRNGAALLALSRLRLASGDGAPLLFDGNFTTGGNGLPQISGRMEQAAGGALTLRMRMREYAAGDARLAVPQLELTQSRSGVTTLRGEARASGALPGGFVQNLALPLDGTIGADGALALWQGCRELRFDQLAVSNLTLARQSLRLCPARGQPILRYGSQGLRLAAGTDGLRLSGDLAGTPIAIASGPVGIGYPGRLSARDMEIALGPAASAQRFRIADLSANLSGNTIGGEFAGTDVFLASVPLDVLGAAGEWRYEDGALLLENGSLTVSDRQSPDRFEPLVARGARLSLEDNRIRANALLREPETDRPIARIAMSHDLSSAIGHSDIYVDGVTFDNRLQPLDLSKLALGVVANVKGTVSGTGRIDWTQDSLTSSGAFASESLDLAAAFGPVTGASGTVVFTDLLGLTTAPDQRIKVASLNPGIEVYDGEVAFQLRDGEVIAVEGGKWPFMGGTLELRPLDITIGASERRTYLMVVDGLEASQFVERMEIGNLAASGTYDGQIPIVFDEDGNGNLEGGILISRPPGGHVSYVGQLTYEDMSFFADYAFRALRDLRYDKAEISLNGPLTGELVTQVRFEGIGQGETAERNFITKRIGELPLELRVNLRAPFYKLISSIRALYDPAAIRDPRTLGLVSDDGERLRAIVTGSEAPEEPPLLPPPAAPQPRRNEPDIQPPESEAMP